MQLHGQFEWDSPKAKSNFNKHGITFDTAAFVLSDDAGDFHHHEQYDPTHSDDEDRYITFASHPQDRQFVLAIVWSERFDGTQLVTRLISARYATPQERKHYAQFIRKKTRP
jgi:uncharacterized protein